MADLHPPRRCEWCDREFQPRTKGDQKPQRFCNSSTCGKAHNKAVYAIGTAVAATLPVAALRAVYDDLKG